MESTTANEHLHLAGEAVAPAQARRFVRQSPTLRTLEAARREDVELLVSELVTNVVRHAHTDHDLTVCLRCGTVCLMVQDYSREMPHVRSDPGEGGWGLRLVAELSDRWGVEPRSDGKAVWLELATGNGVNGKELPDVDDLRDPAHS